MSDRSNATEGRCRRFLARRVAALVLVLAGAHVVTVLAAWHWAAELFVHFLAHYAAAAVLLAAASLALRRYRFAVLCAVLLASDAWRLLDVPPALPVAGEVSDADTVRILYWNVHSANPDPQEALAWILERELTLDVIVLIEVSTRWQPVLAALTRFYPHSASEVRGDNFGIAVFSRLPGSDPRVLTHARTGLVSIVLPARTGSGRELALWAMHPPPPLNAELANDRNEQLLSVARTAAASPLPLVVVGDLNATPWSPWLQATLAGGGLARLDPGLDGATWAPAPLPAWAGLALDHLLATPGVGVVEHLHGPRLGSDHRAQIARVVIPATVD